MSKFPSVTRAEALAAALVLAPACVIISAYTCDRLGLSFTPALMLVPLMTAGALTLWTLWPSADADAVAFATWAALVIGVFAWLMWLARPWWLPLGSGPDLTHHLQLIRYLDEHWHLPREPGIEGFLGEMTFYTPGSHILASLAGAWSGSSGLHALHALVAYATALKVGLVALIARRTMRPSVPRDALSVVAALSLFAAHTYFLGSFMRYSFVAQIVAELFMLFAWWALTVWNHEPRLRWVAMFAIASAALFLTWPILFGPPMLLLGLVLLLPRTMAIRQRALHAVAAAALPLIYAAVFIVGRTAWVQMAGVAGEASRPAVSVYGWPFIACSTAGLVLALTRPRTRVTALMALAILAEAAALAWLAQRQHHVPYMAQKTFYALLFVQAAAVGCVLDEAWNTGQPLAQRLSPRLTAMSHAAAWIVALVTLALAGRSVAAARKTIRLQPAISHPLELAGEWARAQVPPLCVEYLVDDDETAYWLHLAVLGNRRISARTGDDDTYRLTPALVRWLTPGGLPYGIADLPAIPRGVREEFDIVASFDTAAVVRRRGPSTCPP